MEVVSHYYPLNIAMGTEVELAHYRLEYSGEPEEYQLIVKSELGRCFNNEAVLDRSKLRSLHQFVDVEGILLLIDIIRQTFQRDDSE